MSDVPKRQLVRRADQLITEALGDTRVVLINGARQAGKTTLARTIASGVSEALVRTLDAPEMLKAAELDPTGFVEHDGLLVLDEIQRAPGLFLPIKATVDRDTRPGRFLLTGSSQVLALKGLPDALPGRMEIVELWPLSQGEIDQQPDGFIDAIFANGLHITHTSQLRRRDYFDRIVRGGFPEAVRRTNRRRPAFFTSYIRTLIERDVREISAISKLGELHRLLVLLARHTANAIRAGSLAGDVGLPMSTVQRYVDLLAQIYLITEIPAWSSGQTRRTVGAAKLAIVDSGIACHLLGQDASQLGEPTGAGGAMVENFVLMELARQLTWSETRAELFHFRTKDQIEVDAVLESADGRVVGIEVKASSTVRRDDWRGLRHLAERLGDRFVAGLLLYTGEQTLPFGERFRAMPIDALWHLRA